MAKTPTQKIFCQFSVKMIIRLILVLCPIADANKATINIMISSLFCLLYCHASRKVIRPFSVYSMVFFLVGNNFSLLEDSSTIEYTEDGLTLAHCDLLNMFVFVFCFPFLSTSVLMHGGLLCIAFCLFVRPSVCD